MSNQNLVDKWVAIEIRKCPQAMLDRLGYEAVRKLISEEVQINLSHCESDELASKMHAYCKIDTAKVDDYRYTTYIYSHERTNVTDGSPSFDHIFEVNVYVRVIKTRKRVGTMKIENVRERRTGIGREASPT